jgi:hypothetical protein
MSLGCSDLEQVLLDGVPAALAALAEHARGCPDCARQLREWEQISLLAPQLQKRWDSPQLKSRIQRALGDAVPRASVWAWLSAPLRWRQPLAALGAAAVLVAAGTGLWLARRPAPGPNAQLDLWQTIGDPLLTDQAVDEVEAAERQYQAAIERLSKLARPAGPAAGSPLAGSYREKLNLLDAAINELQAGIAGNRLNSNLRRELLTLYQEKQQTLRDLMQIAAQTERQGDLP